jgi:hypothetical protein
MRWWPKDRYIVVCLLHDGSIMYTHFTFLFKSDALRFSQEMNDIVTEHMDRTHRYEVYPIKGN